MEALGPEQQTNNSFNIEINGKPFEISSPGAPDVLARNELILSADDGEPLEPLLHLDAQNTQPQQNEALTEIPAMPEVIEDVQIDPITVTASMAIGGIWKRTDRRNKAKAEKLDKKSEDIDYKAASRKNVAARLLDVDQSDEGATQVTNGKERRQAIRAARRKRKAQNRHGDIQLRNFATSSGKPAERIDGSSGKPNSSGRETRSILEVDRLVDLGGSGQETNSEVAALHENERLSRTISDARQKATARATAEGRTPDRVDFIAELIASSEAVTESDAKKIIDQATDRALEIAKYDGRNSVTKAEVIAEMIASRQTTDSMPELLLKRAKTRAHTKATTEGRTATEDDVIQELLSDETVTSLSDAKFAPGEVNYTSSLSDREGRYQRRLDRKQLARDNRATRIRNKKRGQLHEQHQGADRTGQRLHDRAESIDDAALEEIDKAWLNPNLTTDRQDELLDLEDKIIQRQRARRNNRSRP